MADPGFADAPIVAAFDVDNTLTRRDCVVPFLVRAATWRVAPRLVRNSLPIGWAVIRRDRDRVKELAVQVVLAGQERSRVEAIGSDFARKVREEWLREDTVARLGWHRRNGHRVVLVSASFSAYLMPLGSHLECAAVLGCELEFDEHDRCTGRLVDGNCRGPEKERRLRRWMEESGLKGARVFAYGDSSGDDHLLAMSDRGERIGRSAITERPPLAEGVVNR